MTAPAGRVDRTTANAAYIGIGSNLEGPIEQVLRARDAIAALPKSRFLAFSPLYENPAVGPGEQPDFVNAVAAIETRLLPHALLDALLAIETDQGRVRGTVRWQPRTLDLDLLVYGDRTIDDERLTVPHPHIRERAFVLQPLVDVAPELDVPGLGTVAALLSAVRATRLRRIESEKISDRHKCP